MKSWVRLADTLQGMISGGSLGFVLGMWYCRRAWVGHYRRKMDWIIAEAAGQAEALRWLIWRLTAEVEELQEEPEARNGPAR